MLLPSSTNEVSIMPAHTRTRRLQRIREQRWGQTSFLDEHAEAIGTGNAPREVEDALVAAERASDPTRRRQALDRLYAHLAQEALHRGRVPVPKRRDSHDAP